MSESFMLISDCVNYTQMDGKTKLAWILNNLSITQAPIVAIIYWVIVYSKKLSSNVQLIIPKFSYKLLNINSEI